MTHSIWIGGIAFLVPLFGLRAAESPTPDKVGSINARKESINNLETHITQREQRLSELSKDIVDLDARIEKRMDDLVKLLGGMSDSENSPGEIKRIKQEAVQALKRGMGAYAEKRREVAENIQAGDTQAQGDLGKFDERITKRVDQIAELAKSIPTNPDVDPLKYDGASYWNGFFFETSRLGEEEKLNRRESAGSGKQRVANAKSIKSNIDTLDRRRSSLLNLLSKRKSSTAEKQLYTRELGKLDAYENHLRERLRDVTIASTKDGQPVGMDQAHDIAQLIDDSRRDLREDVSRMFRTYDQFAKERIYVNQLKADLTARKESIDKNAAKETPGQ